MFNLEGQKALITGASGSIGEAIARRLHEQGAIVGLHGTREEKLQKLARELGKRAYVFPADLANGAAIKTLAEKVAAEFGELDILVNNAGATQDALCVRMSDEDWDKVLAVNLTAVFKLTREFAHAMMRRRYGRIINVSSVVGFIGNAGQANYSAAKAGLIGFSKALAQEIVARNVTVNCIAPGLIESAMTDKLSDKVKEMLLSKVPMKRMGTGDDIAAAAVYLASKESSYMTGQTIHVNGGMAMI